MISLPVLNHFGGFTVGKGVATCSQSCTRTGSGSLAASTAGVETSQFSIIFSRVNVNGVVGKGVI